MLHQNSNKMEKSKALKISFLISLLYVGLGTISILSMYPKDLLYGGWVIWCLLITLPVNFISFGLMFMDKDQIFWVFLIQLSVLFLTWFLVYRIFFLKRLK
jgi:hypothetical protein